MRGGVTETDIVAQGCAMQKAKMRCSQFEQAGLWFRTSQHMVSNKLAYEALAYATLAYAASAYAESAYAASAYAASAYGVCL